MPNRTVIFLVYISFHLAVVLWSLFSGFLYSQLLSTEINLTAIVLGILIAFVFILVVSAYLKGAYSLHKWFNNGPPETASGLIIAGHCIVIAGIWVIQGYAISGLVAIPFILGGLLLYTPGILWTSKHFLSPGNTRKTS